MNRPTLDSLIVFAPDLPSAKRFYEQVLGLTARAETPEHLELQGGGFRMTVFRCDAPGSSDDPFAGPGDVAGSRGAAASRASDGAVHG